MQETYLDGLSQDPDVPFSVEQQSVSLEAMPGGPVARKAETGAQVLDITGLIAELEANPDARRRT